MQGVVNGAVSKAFLDLNTTVRKMIDAAVAVTTGQLGLSTTADTLTLLRQGEARAVTPFRRELAQQIAGAILMLDAHVDAVFEEQPRRGHSLPGNDLYRPFRLWVVARLRTAILYERLDELNQSLVQAFSMFGDAAGPLLVETLVLDPRDGHLLRISQQGQHPVPRLLASREDLA